MKIKTILAIAIVTMLVASSCNRFISPFQAANGKARCGRGLR